MSDTASPPPQWLQLQLAADNAGFDALEEALFALGASAVSLEDDGDEPIYEPPLGETPLWSKTRLKALFPIDTDVEALERALQQQIALPYRLEPLEERDWVRACLNELRPLRFGERLWVCPGEHPPPDPTAVNLRLDPGLAFGTGTHATTALCLEWLAQAQLTSQRVLDYGCGSGILAVAAARLGAEALWAVDIDPQALWATRENARRNAVTDERLQVGFPHELPDQARFDLVLANILARPLLLLSPLLAGRCRPGGTLVLAGLLTEQVDAVAAAYSPWFTAAVVEQRDGWARWVAERRR